MMRNVLTIFLIINAQIERADSKNNNKIKLSCYQILTGEVRDINTADLLSGTEVVLSDEEGNILEKIIVNNKAFFSFRIKCKTTYKIMAQKVGYTTQEKEFTTSKRTRKKLKLIIILREE